MISKLKQVAVILGKNAHPAQPGAVGRDLAKFDLEGLEQVTPWEVVEVALGGQTLLWKCWYGPEGTQVWTRMGLLGVAVPPMRTVEAAPRPAPGFPATVDIVASGGPFANVEAASKHFESLADAREGALFLVVEGGGGKVRLYQGLTKAGVAAAWKSRWMVAQFKPAL